ncbi:MAG: FGGY family carbohydrate kinase [Saprospiraceae bacterium]|nr:FGGY family carbohydrate kinase [Saprospiraceae bacterium]
MKKPKSCTAIFDIGRTNKKFFVFDEDYNVIRKKEKSFAEIEDDDGYPAEDLSAIEKWVRKQLSRASADKKIKITALNFSTYGASFVHIGEEGRPVAPLYNYLRPLPQDVLDDFYNHYGGVEMFCQETASPTLGMLNSGLQLLWIKYSKPETHRRIRWSLHLPQYLSFLFTGVPLSDYTSVGCHTGLWDFGKGDYHRWVYAEGLHHNLAPIVPSFSTVTRKVEKKRIPVGVGIHDSSAALLPYLRSDREPFILLSTGTWSIAMNPFNSDALTKEALMHDCLNFQQINGGAVRSARLFLGREYDLQKRHLNQHFGKKKGYQDNITFDMKIYRRLESLNKYAYRFESLPPLDGQPEKTNLHEFNSYEDGAHQLMRELVEAQVHTCQWARGKSAIRKVYIDGGFARNNLFVQTLKYMMPEMEIYTSNASIGSALGAAIAISEMPLPAKFLKDYCGVKKVKRPK